MASRSWARSKWVRRLQSFPCCATGAEEAPHNERRTSVITRAGYLTTRFGGYLRREVPEEDAELSHVGPDTPCGEYLRRFWQPICFSDELKDLPHRVKILGEELVVFRDLSGT